MAEDWDRWKVVIRTLRWVRTEYELKWEEVDDLYRSYADDGDLISIEIKRMVRNVAEMCWE